MAETGEMTLPSGNSASPGGATPGSMGGDMTLPPPTKESTISTATKTAFDSGEAAKGNAPGRWEQFISSLKETSSSSPIGFMPGEPGTLQRAYVQNQMESDNTKAGVLKISPEEANKRYPGLPKPFSEPTDPYVADLIYSDFQKRQKTQDWKDRGGPSPWTDLAAGVAGGFADPLNMALGLATGGLSKAAGMSATLKNIFLQNLSINVATGIPSYFQEKAERQDVTPGGAAVQAVEGAVGGTALHYAAVGLSKVIKGTFSSALDLIRRTPEDTQVRNVRTAVAQHEAGVNTDVTPAMAELSARANGEMNGQASPFKFNPVEHPSQTSYYMAQEGKSHAPIEFGNFGPGSYGVDNGLVANHLAAGSDGGEPGRVARFEPSSKTQFLDLETEANAPENKKLLQEIESKTGVKVAPEEGETLKDVLSRLDHQASQGDAPPDILDQIKSVSQAEGYGGYKYVEHQGTGEPKHNGVVVFDPKNAEPSQVFQANSDIAPRLSDSQKQAYDQEQSAPTSAREYTPEVAKEVRDFKHGPPLNSTPDYMDPIVKDAYTSAKEQLTKMAETDPDLAEEIKSLKLDDATAAQEKNTLKEFANCLTDTSV